MQKALSLTQSEAKTIARYIPNNAVLSDLARFFNLFSDSTRIKILSALAISELCVNDISVVLGLNQTTVSHQLKILRDAGFVGFRRDGKIIYYSLTNKYINEIMLTGVNYLGF